MGIKKNGKVMRQCSGGGIRLGPGQTINDMPEGNLHKRLIETGGELGM